MDICMYVYVCTYVSMDGWMDGWMYDFDIHLYLDA